MISDTGSTGWVGYLYFEITDSTNWIRGFYRISTGELRIQDSNDVGYTYIGTGSGGSW